MAADDVMILPLQEDREISWRPSFYGEYAQLHQEQADQRMWRTPRWKLVRDSRPGKDELYDLANDPGEHRNLIHDRSPRTRQALAELDSALRSWTREIAPGP
ncbi:MAG: DUF4976 domain-containing protein [Bryobacterales bacterium]|nr:DUF4976 domain-containing protein [Bryobacterales bacterium]